MRTIQPATAAGLSASEDSFLRCCQASQAAARIISGPWPSCSVCQGPLMSFTYVGA